MLKSFIPQRLYQHLPPALFIFLLLVFSNSVQAADIVHSNVRIDNINYNLYSDETAEIGNNPDYEGDVVIPETIDYNGKSYRVTNMVDAAFEYSRLQSISLPNSLTNIREKAFHGCERLSSITFGNSLETIGNMAFMECRQLKTLDFPSSLKTIGCDAFSGCYCIESISFGNSLETIGDVAFMECHQLKTLNFPSSLKTIGGSAFSYCDGIESISFGDSLETIETAAFSRCENLKTLNFPSSLKTIRDRAFSFCSGIESISFGDSLETIGTEAFGGCGDIKEIILPPSLKTLCEKAFSQCTVNKIAYPSTINLDISEISLSGIYNDGIKYPAENSVIENGIIFDKDRTTIFYATIDLEGEISIPSGIKTIAQSAYRFCDITNVTIPETVTTIGKKAFADTNISNLNLKNVSIIDSDAFSMCGLTSLTLPGSMTKVGASAFYGNDNLKQVIIEYGDNILDLDRSAFAELNIEKLYIGKNVTISDAYDDNPGLRLNKCKTLTFGNQVTEIPPYICKDWESLSSLTLGSKIEKIGEYAFNGCSGLTEFISTPALKEIGDFAFADCDLETIKIGSNVTSVGKSAFAGSIDVLKIISTAIIPPKAFNSTFSTYYCPLYVESESMNAYKESEYCWNQFTSYALITPTAVETNEENITYAPGTSVQLSATIIPSNVTNPEIFWESTNPSIASVDANGLVTFHEPENNANMPHFTDSDTPDTIDCEIHARTLYADAPIAVVKVGDPSGINSPITHNVETSPAETLPNIYNMQGILLKASATQEYIDNLPAGLYIIGGKKVLKK